MENVHSLFIFFVISFCYVLFCLFYMKYLDVLIMHKGWK